MRNSAAFLGAVAFGLWGCAPKPELVSIDSGLVKATHPTVALTRPPAAVPSVGSESGTLPAKAADQVYEGKSRRLNAEALASLQANRQTAINRFVAELQRRLLGELDLERRDGSEQLRALAEQEWQDVSAKLRELFEQYSDERGQVLLELSGHVGFPDRGKPVRPKGPNDVFADFRAEKVASLRKRLADLDERFDTLATELVEGYRQAVERRAKAFNESAGVRVDQVRAEAAKQAKEAVRLALAGVESDFPVVDRKLDALPGIAVSASPPKAVRPTLNPGKTSDPGPNVQDWAKLFAKTHGYRLAKPGPGVRDATKEFQTWVARQQVGH